MPKDFNKCVNQAEAHKNGAHVVTKDIGKNKYIHLCYDANGKSHHGEVKTKHPVAKHPANKS